MPESLQSVAIGKSARRVGIAACMADGRRSTPGIRGEWREPPTGYSLRDGHATREALGGRKPTGAFRLERRYSADAPAPAPTTRPTPGARDVRIRMSRRRTSNNKGGANGGINGMRRRKTHLVENYLPIHRRGGNLCAGGPLLEKRPLIAHNRGRATPRKKRGFRKTNRSLGAGGSSTFKGQTPARRRSPERWVFAAHPVDAVGGAGWLRLPVGGGVWALWCLPKVSYLSLV